MNISIFLLYFLTLLSILLSPLYDITRLSLFGFLPTTLLEILLLGTFCFWIIIKIKRRDFSWPKTSLDKLIVFLLLGSFISILLGPHKIFSIGRWRAFFLEPIIFYYLISFLHCDFSISIFI